MPLESIPKGSDKAGEALTVTGKDGNTVVCTVKEVKGDKAVLDFNHPLAGKTLRYRVEVVGIKDVRQLKM